MIIKPKMENMEDKDLFKKRKKEKPFTVNLINESIDNSVVLP